MSLWDSLFASDKAQTQAEADANYARLQGELQAQGKDLGANAGTLQDPGSAAASSLLNSLTLGSFGDAGPQPDGGDTGTGFGALFKDVLVLAAIAGAIYLFVKLGGIGKLKRLAS